MELYRIYVSEVLDSHNSYIPFRISRCNNLLIDLVGHGLSKYLESSSEFGMSDLFIQGSKGVGGAYFFCSFFCWIFWEAYFVNV